jgi:ClpP class serine protease
MANEKRIAIKQPPTRFPQTQQLIDRIEAQLGGKLITYWNNPRGSVCHSDVVALYELLQGTGKHDKLFLFVKSDGGNGQASLRIVNLIRRHCRRLTVLVPLECASAATMIAIGADEILMGPMAYLTAVDTSLTHDLSPIDRDNDRVRVSLDELKRVVRLWRGEKENRETNPYHALFQHVHPLVIGAVARADSLSIMLCKELLSYHIANPKRADKIADALNSRYPSHSYPIQLEEAQRIGLKAKPLVLEVNDMLLELNELYSEMGQKATTDFSEIRAHGNEIVNILEIKNRLVYFKQDKDWFYRAEERRWITMNDHSGWRKIERVGGRMTKSVLHIA